MASRFTSDDKAFPCGRWLLGFGGDDINLIPVLQFCIQRCDASVDFCADTFVTDIRMDGIGKINRGCAGRKLNQVAFGCEGEDLILEKLEFGVFPEFRGVREASDIFLRL